MQNTHLAIIAIVALATAVALTPVVVQQQAFAQPTDGLQSSTDTDNQVKQKCNISGIGNDCHEAGKSRLGVE